MQTKIEKIVPGEGENSHLAKGVVINGEELPADLVIMGVGVSPATEFLKGSGIQLEDDGGVKVDDHMRVLNVPENVTGVYAVGKFFIRLQADLSLMILGQGTLRISLTTLMGSTGALSIGMLQEIREELQVPILLKQGSLSSKFLSSGVPVRKSSNRYSHYDLNEGLQRANSSAIVATVLGLRM